MKNTKKFQKLSKFKLKLTDEFLNYYSGGLKNLKVLKFQRHVYNINKYLTELEIYRGLYSFTRYEYELFLVNNVDLKLLFIEYSLILDAKVLAFQKSLLVTYKLYDITNEIKFIRNVSSDDGSLINRIQARQSFLQKKQKI